jgi:hypothetical protein
VSINCSKFSSITFNGIYVGIFELPYADRMMDIQVTGDKVIHVFLQIFVGLPSPRKKEIIFHEDFTEEHESSLL